jgi:hypothetical protein
MDNSNAANAPIFSRSRESKEFEAFWHSMRGEHSMPSRADFHPGKARRFVGDLVLMEVPREERAPIRIRVTGAKFDEMIGSDLTGRSPADFLPEAYRADVVASSRLLLEKPCGLWQISPAHLVRGFAMHLEITMFPLAADPGTTPFLLAHVRSLGDLMRAYLPTTNGLGLDTAAAFRFLDVGAGEPEWIAQAA